MRRVALFVAVLVAAGGAAACGESENENDVASALGARSEADKQQVERFVRRAAPFSGHSADFIREVQQGDAVAAERARARLHRTLDAMRAETRRIEDPEVAGTLQRYMGTLGNAVAAYDRFAALFYERDPPQSKIDEVTADVRDRTLKAQAADRALLEQIVASLPEDEREAWRKTFKEAVARSTERAKP